MIDARELRLGNWVEYDNRHFQIDSIADVFPTLNTPEFGIGVVDYNNIKPIHLAEEWLLKLGLTHLYGDDFVLTIFKNSFKDSEVCFQRYDSTQAKIWWRGRYLGIVQRLEFVHQFQNFIFALTGQELTLNPQP